MLKLDAILHLFDSIISLSMTRLVSLSIRISTRVSYNPILDFESLEYPHGAIFEFFDKIHRRRNHHRDPMKPTIQKFFTCSFLVVLPLFLGIAFLSTFVSQPSELGESETCVRTYEGTSKGTFWDRGEWHHYIDFSVDGNTPGYMWRITEAPLPSSILRRYAHEFSERVTYRWPSNWWDPFPASNWKICLLDS